MTDHVYVVTVERGELESLEIVPLHVFARREQADLFAKQADAAWKHARSKTPEGVSDGRQVYFCHMSPEHALIVAPYAPPGWQPRYSDPFGYEVVEVPYTDGSAR